jgi:hypothetical protein
MMNKRTIPALLATVGILAGAAGASAGQTTATVVPSELARLAEVAKTPSEHIAVSKQYRSQAEEFERQALKHEAAARKVEATPAPLEHKWPALGRRTGAKERQLAMEARRAARESIAAADRHFRLSVEALAQAADRDKSRTGSVD